MACVPPGCFGQQAARSGVLMTRLWCGGAITACCILAALPLEVASSQELSTGHQRLNFLVGEWATISETAQGTTIPGRLEYQWVLGGQWLKVVFVGRPEDGRVWEAYAMLKYDPERGEYSSCAFFGANDPVRYRGYPVDDSTMRFEHETDTGTSGIDYHDRGDGTVYQENWSLSPTGERTITLRTTYTPAAE